MTCNYIQNFSLLFFTHKSLKCLLSKGYSFLKPSVQIPENAVTTIMILTGKEIKKKYFDNLIKIDPFSVENITTNSYDISLGHNLLRYTSEVIDPKKENSYEIFTIPTSGHLMTAGTFLLGETLEKFGSDHYVPIIHGKSGIARMGLFVHITADLFDIGYYGKSTLQLFATLPVRLFAEMKIAQVTFWKPKGVIELYRGKYQNSSKPTPSQIFRDFS